MRESGLLGFSSSITPLGVLFLTMGADPWGKAKTPVAVEFAISEDQYQKSQYW